MTTPQTPLFDESGGLYPPRCLEDASSPRLPWHPLLKDATGMLLEDTRSSMTLLARSLTLLLVGILLNAWLLTTPPARCSSRTLLARVLLDTCSSMTLVASS